MNVIFELEGQPKALATFLDYKWDLPRKDDFVDLDFLEGTHEVIRVIHVYKTSPMSCQIHVVLRPATEADLP